MKKDQNLKIQKEKYLTFWEKKRENLKSVSAQKVKILPKNVKEILLKFNQKMLKHNMCMAPTKERGV